MFCVFRWGSENKHKQINIHHSYILTSPKRIKVTSNSLSSLLSLLYSPPPTETKWVGPKAKEVDGYKLWFSGKSGDRNGVGILVDSELRDQVVEVRRVNDRMMTIKLVVEGFTLNIISAYAPQVGLDEEVKRRFWEDLDEVVGGIPLTEKLFVRGDFNGHIGSVSRGYNDVHGGFGFGDRNGGGVSLLDFARAFAWW
ncbi:uncharacterized protein LOC132607736 [Lycium barbarum]|uniref:uncharacterized protein LOC132607736 n=1 Tax=Lycium barbarum TaxID=112863 RepID=UPI00293EC526|nr:uncharacterized protein LOC132607736 [Lycium barbarum]